MDLVRLDDGTALLVRPIEATDKAMLAAGLTRLSETSRQKRFLGPKPRLTTAELRYLTEVDGHDHFAVVAGTPADGEIVGSAPWGGRATHPPTPQAAGGVWDAVPGQGPG